jgi:hypothetical protein
MRLAARRVRDFAAYIVIGLAVGFGVIWCAYHSHGLRDEFLARWGGLALNTAVLHGYFISWSKRFWRVWGFWLAMVSVLIIHLIVFTVILQHTDHWSVVWLRSSSASPRISTAALTNTCSSSWSTISITMYAEGIRWSQAT